MFLHPSLIGLLGWSILPTGKTPPNNDDNDGCLFFSIFAAFVALIFYVILVCSVEQCSDYYKEREMEKIQAFRNQVNKKGTYHADSIISNFIKIDSSKFTVKCIGGSEYRFHGIVFSNDYTDSLLVCLDVHYNQWDINSAQLVQWEAKTSDDIEVKCISEDKLNNQRYIDNVRKKRKYEIEKAIKTLKLISQNNYYIQIGMTKDRYDNLLIYQEEIVHDFDKAFHAYEDYPVQHHAYFDKLNRLSDIYFTYYEGFRLSKDELQAYAKKDIKWITKGIRLINVYRGKREDTYKFASKKCKINYIVHKVSGKCEISITK